MTQPPAEIVTEVITLADVRKDVQELRDAFIGLASDVRASGATTAQRVNTLEDRDADKEQRIRALESTAATKVELQELRAQQESRAEAAKGRWPAWAGVVVAACTLLLTLGGTVVGIALALR